MPRIKGTTNRQSSFLRAFRLHPAGPPPEAWPSPAILRRWLRHDGFQRAFHDLRRTLQTMLEFQSLTTGLAAAHALHALHADLTPDTAAAAAATPPPDAHLNPEPRTLNPLSSPQHEPHEQQQQQQQHPEPKQGSEPEPEQKPERHQRPQHQPDPAQDLRARLTFEREKLRHRAMLTTLRLAHARLTRSPRPPAPPREPVAPPPPEPATEPEPEPEETVEEAARRLMHPNCRPEVMIAFLKGEPHPDRAREEAEEAARAAATAGDGSHDASASRTDDDW